MLLALACAMSGLSAMVVPETVCRADGGGSAAVAESLFREGKAAMDKKDYARACPKFAESLRQDASSGAALALGVCYAGQGKTASAWSAYLTAATLARRDGRKDREKAAAQRAAELEKKLAHVTLDLAPETRALTGLEVKQDDASVGSAAWENSPIDPGSHTLTVTAPHKKPFETTFTVDATASSQSVKVPVLEDDYVAPPEQAGGPRGGAAREPEKTSVLRTTGFILGGAGLVSLVVGGVFGGVAISQGQDAKKKCPTVACSNQSAVSENHDAETFADVSTVTMAIGGVALVAGAIFVLTSPTPSAKTGAALYPIVGIGSGTGSVGMGGSF